MEAPAVPSLSKGNRGTVRSSSTRLGPDSSVLLRDFDRANAKMDWSDIGCSGCKQKILKREPKNVDLLCHILLTTTIFLVIVELQTSCVILRNTKLCICASISFILRCTVITLSTFE